MTDPKKNLPFRGILYNQQQIASLKDVVSPPYDVISPEMQEELYVQSPYNFCRLDLTRENPPERYEIARQTFTSWREHGILTVDSHPAIYLHHQSFILPSGEPVTRRGFFAMRRLEDFSEGGIKPHEKTLAGPKQDRLELMRALEMQLSPVFTLYRDPDNRITNATDSLTQNTPFVDFVSSAEERHQMWKLRDPELINLIDSTLANSPLFIADGHHRYETALNYRNEILSAHPDLPDNAAVRFVLMYFSGMHDPGMTILPIHRALHHLENFSAEDLLNRLSADFQITPMSVQDDVKIERVLANAPADSHHFFIMAKDPRHTSLISLTKEKWLAHPACQNLEPALRDLDVTVLHRHVFENILGMSEEDQAGQKNIIYWKSTKRALEETQKGHCDATFLLNPTRMEQMENVAMAGLKMPQKSTYFYPKIVSGLILHDVQKNATDGF